MARRTTTKPAHGGATPAVTLLTRLGVPFTEHHYDHDPDAESFGREAAEKLGVDPAVVLKTLVVDLSPGGGRGLGVAILPVDHRLDLKAAGAGLGVKKVALADHAAAERSSGYVAGGISPLGQRTVLPTVLDESTLAHETVYVSGGRRGFDVAIAPADLVSILSARTAPITR
ncbi:Cys-tRNA(Pro) deacylase [Mobilicoccus pelagius]|uniref:Cys-tRNA(Pro)/Cys-tRNA(Cys) deacylase n=1 Tax=Mobilicoccus pelagius NBRC 104925 TaxID=1089455 RepID=H5UTF0_9MICO|nr:Cys-tRNA(Pro) deacylase [Mobilicoccus pelagius]GAB49008.1 putative aminoacyl-tRNA deacylase [Mobilicoccus pelagius NBRC 104925]